MRIFFKHLLNLMLDLNAKYFLRVGCPLYNFFPHELMWEKKQFYVWPAVYRKSKTIKRSLLTQQQ